MYKYFLSSIFLIVVIGCGRRNDADKLRFLEKGNKAYTNNDLSEAIRFYEEALIKDSTFVDAWNNKGLALTKQAKFDDAIYCFNQALFYKPNYGEALLNNARANLEVHQHFAALEDLSELNKLWPDTSIVYFTKGLIHADMGEEEIALLDFRKAFIKDRTNAETMVNIANIYYHMQKPDSSVIYLQKALKLDAKQPQAYNILAMVYAYKAEYDDALMYITTAISYDNDDAYFINNKGFILLKLMRLEEAEEDIIQSMKMDPYNGWVYRNLGLVRYAQGNLSEAVRLIDKALSMDNSIDNIYHDLAVVYKELGELDKACDLLLTAPQNEEIVSLTKELCE